MLAMRRQPMVWVALAALALVLVGRAAFAAANTVPETSAGQGEAVVSGFVITNIDYDLDATDPNLIDRVTFDADGAVTGLTLEVWVKFDDSDTYFNCTDGLGENDLTEAATVYTITCDTDGTPLTAAALTVANADTFDVIIVQQ